MTSDAGLSSAQAAEGLARWGPNRVPEPPRVSLVRRVLVQVRDPMILLLVVAAVVAAVLGNHASMAIILLVIVVNTTAGVVQELRAEHAMAALRVLAHPEAEVRRDGEFVRIPAEELVPGDVVALRSGEVVAADGSLVVAHDLEVNEAAMTGESVPVGRTCGERLSAGTAITRGRGVLLVDRTGADSALGRIAADIAGAPVRRTPLQRRLDRLSRTLVRLVLVLTALVVAVGLIGGRSPGEMAMVGLSLAVAAVPESLPAVVTVGFALGAARMARRHAIVRRLPAVETLGAVSVVATDKTGTITEGTMRAEVVWTPHGCHTVTGDGYDPEGSLVPDGEADPRGHDELLRLARAVALCNDARLTLSQTGWAVVGDPLEGAMLALAARAGIDVTSVRGTYARIGEEPFDVRTRRMTTRHHVDGDVLTVCKGAPEAVLEVARGDEAVVLDQAGRLGSQGYRVIAVADDEHHPGVLSLIGLVGIGDPPRHGITEVVRGLGRAGVRTVLLTGDHPGTAEAIAHKVGIAEADDHAVLGTDLAGRGISGDVRVVARVAPWQKVEVVQALQSAGEVVAMLGDGVNDAPALRRADIGVAPGRTGTEVAKEAADLVVADDDLGTVLAAIQEGRRIVANIGSFLAYALAGGLSEVAVMLFGPAVGLGLPLLPGQILWINLVTHGLTGVAFGSEPADPADMTRPPRPVDASVLDARGRRALVLATVCLTIVALGAGFVATDDAGRRTAVFLALGLGQLGVALALRVRGIARTWRQRLLEAAVLAAGAMMAAGVLWPFLSELLGTSRLPARSLMVVVLAAAVPGVLVALSRSRRLGPLGPRAGDLRPLVRRRIGQDS